MQVGNTKTCGFKIDQKSVKVTPRRVFIIQGKFSFWNFGMDKLEDDVGINIPHSAGKIWFYFPWLEFSSRGQRGGVGAEMSQSKSGLKGSMEKMD